MRKTNKSRVFIGDIVETTDSFKPRDKNESRVPLYGQRLKGFVVTRRGEYYGVRFGEGLTFTDYLDGLLSKPVGKLLHRSEFEVIDY